MKFSHTLQVYLHGNLLDEDHRYGYRLIPDDEHFAGCIHFKNNIVAPGSRFSIVEVNEEGQLEARHDFEIPGYDPKNPAPDSLFAEKAFIDLDVAFLRTKAYRRPV